MKPSQLQRSKVQVPFGAVDFFEVAVLAGEDVTHVHPALLSANAAGGADQADLVVALAELGLSAG